MNVIGYLRVSTDEQDLGIAAQRASITAEAKRRGWHVTYIEDDGFSAKDLNRPGIQHALRLLACGGADALVAAKLDRLSRSVLDFANTLALAQRQGWAVVLLDLGVDTTTPSGKMLANVMVTFAEYERDLISLRTKEALAALKAQGKHVGRRSRVPADTRQQIIDLHDSGETPTAIARILTSQSVARPDGEVQPWTPAAVVRVLQRAGLYEPVSREHLTGKAGRKRVFS